MYCQSLSKRTSMVSFEESDDNFYHIRNIFFNSGIILYEAWALILGCLSSAQHCSVLVFNNHIFEYLRILVLFLYCHFSFARFPIFHLFPPFCLPLFKVQRLRLSGGALEFRRWPFWVHKFPLRFVCVHKPGVSFVSVKNPYVHGIHLYPEMWESYVISSIVHSGHSEKRCEVCLFKGLYMKRR
jgi:hypothetical protein